MDEHDPSLVAQLQDLVLIETRPSWRRWADGQLALFFNDSLDRGPTTPDFHTGADRDSESSSESREKNTIDLTPPASLEVDPEQPPASQGRILSGPNMSPTAEAETLPLPTSDTDSLELNDADRNFNAGDYFQ